MRRNILTTVIIFFGSSLAMLVLSKLSEDSAAISTKTEVGETYHGGASPIGSAGEAEAILKSGVLDSLLGLPHKPYHMWACIALDAMLDVDVLKAWMERDIWRIAKGYQGAAPHVNAAIWAKFRTVAAHHPEMFLWRADRVRLIVGDDGRPLNEDALLQGALKGIAKFYDFSSDEEHEPYYQLRTDPCGYDKSKNDYRQPLNGPRPLPPRVRELDQYRNNPVPPPPSEPAPAPDTTPSQGSPGNTLPPRVRELDGVSRTVPEQAAPAPTETQPQASPEPAPESPSKLPSVPVEPLLRTRPKPIYKPDPTYTEEAQRAKVVGTIRIRVVIDTAGAVYSATLVSAPLGFGLDESALEAAKKWRWEPAMQDGHPVISNAVIEFSARHPDR